MQTLPVFDVADIEEYLKPRISKSNRKACMCVITKLTSGKGITHRSKPGETFLKGHILGPLDDLVKIKEMASEWLPHRGTDCLDKGHGWALNHPLQKLMDYKRDVFNGVATASMPVVSPICGPLTMEQVVLAHACGVPSICACVPPM